MLTLSSCNKRTEIPDEVTSQPVKAINDQASELKKVSFYPYWLVNAQFAGYYVAREMGIYKRYGLDVEIIPFEHHHSSAEMLQTGKTDFAVLWLLNAIEMKASGIDLVNIAQFSRKSSLMFITKKTSGINKLEDMDGKKAGIWNGYELQPRTLFKKYNLDVELIPIGSTVNLFLRDAVEITNASWFDEYHTIINAGYDPEELNTFFFADHGFNFLEDGIYCMKDMLEQSPEVCASFAEATKEGWKMAFENPEKTIDIVMEYARERNQSVNSVHQRWMLERYRDLYMPGSTITTVLASVDYHFAGYALEESGQINWIPDFDEFYQHYNKSLVKK